MAGRPGRSGGGNALSLDEHLARGTFRADRHARLTLSPPPREMSAADTRRVLAGLPRPARALARRLLAEFSGWTPATLETLRAYVLSCDRLERLQHKAGTDPRDLHREIRGNLSLLREMRLED